MSTIFFEIDFVKAGENCSGDAIALRYQTDDGSMKIHVVDGGYTNDGQKLVDHINATYNYPNRIDHVVLTHPDRDHAAGLQTVLEEFSVGGLWMNRPWSHIDELLPRFDYAYTREGLIQRLKKDFPHTATLEALATQSGIPIYDTFQGQAIGEFIVLSPTREFYLDMIVASEKTPEAEREETVLGRTFEVVREAARYVAQLWGVENLKGDITGTSSENETSIVQYANLCGEGVLLTGDAGVQALEEAHSYAVAGGLTLPGIDKFQIPHHGARRNLSTEILDKWLGPRLAFRPDASQLTFSAMISAHENDEDHPRKAVLRAIWHRGGHVTSTERQSFVYWKGRHQEWRPGTSGMEPINYPESEEE